MNNKNRKKERFLRDAIPFRLAALAANLARVSSSARHETGGASVEEMLEESQYYIEWMAADVEPEIAADIYGSVGITVMKGDMWCGPGIDKGAI
jgi:hypothetical protein